jgi:thiosulfate/3-mercaptopyruvate sulfurtransferase
VVAHNGAPVADSAYIRARLGNAEVGLLDVRSAGEFTGGRRYAERGGHIPGAVNLEWTMAMDQTRNLRFKPDAELERLLSRIGITPDKEIITYCQSHHRSAHTYIVLRHLGSRVKGYPGSGRTGATIPICRSSNKPQPPGGSHRRRHGLKRCSR